MRFSRSVYIAASLVVILSGCGGNKTTRGNQSVSAAQSSANKTTGSNSPAGGPAHSGPSSTGTVNSDGTPVPSAQGSSSDSPDHPNGEFPAQPLGGCLSPAGPGEVRDSQPDESADSERDLYRITEEEATRSVEHRPSAASAAAASADLQFITRRTDETHHTRRALLPAAPGDESDYEGEGESPDDFAEGLTSSFAESTRFGAPVDTAMDTEEFPGRSLADGYPSLQSGSSLSRSQRSFLHGLVTAVADVDPSYSELLSHMDPPGDDSVYESDDGSRTERAAGYRDTMLPQMLADSGSYSSSQFGNQPRGFFDPEPALRTVDRRDPDSDFENSSEQFRPSESSAIPTQPDGLRAAGAARLSALTHVRDTGSAIGYGPAMVEVEESSDDESVVIQSAIPRTDRASSWPLRAPATESFNVPTDENLASSMMSSFMTSSTVSHNQLEGSMMSAPGLEESRITHVDPVELYLNGILHDATSSLVSDEVPEHRPLAEVHDESLASTTAARAILPGAPGDDDELISASQPVHRETNDRAVDMPAPVHSVAADVASALLDETLPSGDVVTLPIDAPVVAPASTPAGERSDSLVLTDVPEEPIISSVPVASAEVPRSSPISLSSRLVSTLLNEGGNPVQQGRSSSRSSRSSRDNDVAGETRSEDSRAPYYHRSGNGGNGDNGGRQNRSNGGNGGNSGRQNGGNGGRQNGGNGGNGRNGGIGGQR